MAKLIDQAMYIKSNVQDNNNKFWEIKIYDDCTAHVRNGRVGSSGQTQPIKSFGSIEETEKFFKKKIREKENPRKGYTKSKVLMNEDNSSVTVSKSDNLVDIALKEIGSDSETSKLLKLLSDRNIHNIVSSTTITYDKSKGNFETPLGIITQDGIDEARIVLDELVPFVTKKKYTNKKFINKFQDYLQLIPHKVGRKLIPEDILPNDDSIQKEGQILDALDASLQMVLGSTNKIIKKTSTSKIFDVKVEILDNKKEWNRIRDYYHRTRKTMHTSYTLDVKKIYIIDIKQMSDLFNKKGKKIGNIRELWHGSRIENCLSILKSGLIIPKSFSSHVTGRMFGDGVYASDISTKALNYAQGYWGHGKMESNCFMFLVDFAMGKEYIPTSYSETLPKNGYDSTWAKEGKSGVSNNEMIVYNLHQCNIKYLVEFDN